MSRAVGVFGLLAVLVGCPVLVGCGTDATTCTTNEECPVDNVCRAGSCFPVAPTLDCADNDGDGYFSGPACEASRGMPDCDDDDGSINPGVVDQCGADNMGDGVDQNCMNGIDDGCACGGGATREDCGLGLCAGTRMCTDGTWTDCLGGANPVQEDCGSDQMGNTLDEDCDGRVDEGCIMCPERLDGMGQETLCPGGAMCSSNGTCA